MGIGIGLTREEREYLEEHLGEELSRPVDVQARFVHWLRKSNERGEGLPLGEDPIQLSDDDYEGGM